MKALLYARTIRHLKPIQIAARLAKPFPGRPLAARPAPALRSAPGPFAPPVAKPRSLFPPDRAVFLGAEGCIATAADWNALHRQKLWLYNLHYFDDLSAAPAEDPAAQDAMRRALVTRWIAENRVGAGNGWEPYPTSLRIVNWIKWALAGTTLEPGWRDSLAVQARWLARRVEWHLLGNHVLANAKGLVFAGLYFEGGEAERWLAQGLSIYRREIPDQILSDGGHIERSPMYHAIILEDVLDVLNLARWSASALPEIAAITERVPDMLRWLAAMAHPDGDIAFFNDAAFGIAASPSELAAYATRLGLVPPADSPHPRMRHLAASGYVRVDAGPLAAILDLAPVGSDYLPGHAHADTLSFELSLHGRRVVVNGGTSTYSAGEERHRQRGTAAHATVEVDGRDSSEMWGAFRVARRAHVHDVAVAQNGTETRISAWHDGYRGRGGPVHARTFRIAPDQLVVEDRLEGPHREALAHFPLAEGVRAVPDGPLGICLALPGGRVARVVTTAPAGIEPRLWHPRFGESVPSSALVVPLAAGRLVTKFTWS